MKGRPFIALTALVAALTATGCTEDPLVVLDPESAPGVSTPTIEVVLDASELPSWRDTTYWGFVLPEGAAFQLATDTDGFVSRPIGRFSNIPDSLFVDTARVAIESFPTAVFRVAVDTARTSTPAQGVEVAFWSLTRSFDAEQVTWEQAREGEPWTTPGGDLGTLLGVDTVTLAPDSLGIAPDTFVVPLLVDADSLLQAWRASEGEPGFALVATGQGADMRLETVAVVAQAVPEGGDTTLTVVRGSLPSTFIYDPPTPPPSTRLRVAGIPAARYYIDFELPDSIGPLELRGATINNAAVEFRPTAGAPPPFALEGFITGQAVRLLADPFEFYEKTPIGSALGAPVILDPDSLAAGSVVQYDISSLIRLWSQTPADSTVPLRIGIVPLPENRQFGFWEFFSTEDSPGVRPVVRLLFTPNPSFLLP